MPHVDNFDIIKDHLFTPPLGEGEFFLVLVLRRRKDVAGSMSSGVNEDNRLLHHYFVYEKEYLTRKKQAIVDLCDNNNARAYILPQRRDSQLVLWGLLAKVTDALKHNIKTVRFDHMIRTSIAGMHETAHRSHNRWVLDLDKDDAIVRDRIEHLGIDHEGEECPFDTYVRFLETKFREAICSQERSEEAQAYMPTVNATYSPTDVFSVPTPNGAHIITPPFNRDPNAMSTYFKSLQPWGEMIKADAMTLLYAPAKKEKYQ